MDTVRDGLRAGDLEKDTFDRLVCVGCDRTLKIRNEPEKIGSIRFCIECDQEWHEMR